MELSALLEFITELAYPVDPWVFAGYGSGYQNNVCGAAAADLDDIEREHIAAFVRSNEPEELLTLLVKVFSDDSIDTPSAARSRKRDVWNAGLRSVIARVWETVLDRATPLFLDLAQTARDRREDIIDILAGMDPDVATPIIGTIERSCGDLTDSERTLIDDFRSDRGAGDRSIPI